MMSYECDNLAGNPQIPCQALYRKEGDAMNLASHPLIQKMASIESEMLPLFSPTERAVIETCKEVVDRHNRHKKR